MVVFESLLYNFGYLGLFLITFLAATLFPLSSEIFVIIMLNLNYNPWLIVIFAVIGNSLGATTNYYIGKYGNKFFLSKFIKVKPKKREHAQELYKKWGAPVLFFSWLPIIGDPLCIIPGIMNLNIRIFAFWIILGRIFRYAAVVGAVTLFF